MKTNHTNQRQGFTLIEMVGVLAVIAILAAILVPKIFSAIEESKYNNTVGSINNVKAATMAYFAKKSTFDVDNGTTKFDNRLITAGELERPFAAKLGSAWECNALAAASAGGSVGFGKLDGTTNVVASGTVVQCKLTGVPRADAWELSKRIDGADMSATALGDVDDEGRVVYAATADPVDVYVYLAHK